MQTQDSFITAKTGTSANLVFLGLTLIIIGFFMTWLPGPSAGLQIIGIELGEWIKFLGVGSSRNWFYFPPIAAGLILALLASGWPNDSPRTWLARGVAIGVAMLSFPAVAVIQMEPRSEWLGRVLAIGFVAVVAAVGALIPRNRPKTGWVWLPILVVSLAGAILPTVQYFTIRPVVEDALRQSIGIGAGVWINAGGALLVAAIATAELMKGAQTKRTATGRAAVLKE